MKTQVYFHSRPDFSERLQLHIDPVDHDKDAQNVVDSILQILEGELEGKRIEVIEGLEQTFIDYDIGGYLLTFQLNPWNFVSILALDDKLREEVKRRIEAEFEIVPRPAQDGDDE